MLREVVLRFVEVLVLWGTCTCVACRWVARWVARAVFARPAAAAGWSSGAAQLGDPSEGPTLRADGRRSAARGRWEASERLKYRPLIRGCAVAVWPIQVCGTALHRTARRPHIASFADQFELIACRCTVPQVATLLERHIDLVADNPNLTRGRCCRLLYSCCRLFV